MIIDVESEMGTTGKMNDLWTLEHSQHSEDAGMYPWHIGPLKDAIEGNLRDCQHNNRGPNKWQIVYIGPDGESCGKVCDQLIRIKGRRQERWQKRLA